MGPNTGLANMDLQGTDMYCGAVKADQQHFGQQHQRKISLPGDLMELEQEAKRDEKGLSRSETY